MKDIDKQKKITGMRPLGLTHQLLDDGGSDHVGQQREPHHLLVQLSLHLRRHADEEPGHGLQLPRHPHRLHPPGHRHVFHCNDCHYLLAADQGRERVHIGFQKLLFRIFFLHIHFANFDNFLEL